MDYKKIFLSVRHELGYSQQRMSYTLGIAQPRVSLIERGISKPTLSQLEKLATLTKEPLPVLLLRSYKKTKNVDTTPKEIREAINATMN